MALHLLSRRGLLLAPIARPKISLSLDVASSQVVVKSGGKAITAFHYGKQWPKPFLYPLLSPAGTVLTRGFPVAQRPEDSNDHAWHRGIWIGHGDINGFDFWREITPDNTGRIEVVASPVIESNGFRADTRLLPPDRSDHLATLRQEWRFSWQPGGLAVDARFEYRALSSSPLRFGDTDDGGFGIRLREEFRQDRGAILANSEGGRGTSQLWGKPARWVDYSAIVGGGHCGVTIFDSPLNLRYPSEWHARPYALNAANPFAHRSFNGKAAPSGEYEVRPGGTLRLGYRVLLHDEISTTEALDQEAKRVWK